MSRFLCCLRRDEPELDFSLRSRDSYFKSQRFSKKDKKDGNYTRQDWIQIHSHKINPLLHHHDQPSLDELLGNFHSLLAQQNLASLVMRLVTDHKKDWNMLVQDNVSKGDVMITRGYVNSSSVFIIKTDFKNQASTIHEVSVGLACTNAMRFTIPNFAYVYGIFCPLLKKEVWMSVYEFIPGKTLADSLGSLSPVDFMWLYVQMLVALQFAYETCHFTHYDCHTRNVILRPVDHKALIRVPIANKVLYCRTNGLVATFIDFESCYYESGTVSFCPSDVKNQFPLILGDAYDLLESSLSEMREMNPSSYRELLSVMKFFNKEDNLDEFVQSGCHIALPTRRNRKHNLLSLISFCRSWLKKRGMEDPVMETLTFDSRQHHHLLF